MRPAGCVAAPATRRREGTAKSTGPVADQADGDRRGPRPIQVIDPPEVRN